MGRACMGTGDVDLFPSTARRLGVGKVCDEDYPFACQYCRERWLKKKERHEAIKKCVTQRAAQKDFWLQGV